jgi:hypothetical protein
MEALTLRLGIHVCASSWDEEALGAPEAVRLFDSARGTQKRADTGRRAGPRAFVVRRRRGVRF